MEQSDSVYLESKKVADKEIELGLRKWICEVLEEPFVENETIEDHLKSGVRLCKLINLIKPNIVPRINNSKFPFQQMENISNYINACRELGMIEANIFQTVDLYESKNISQVFNNIINLACIATATPTFKGPNLTSLGGKSLVVSTPALKNSNPDINSSSKLKKVESTPVTFVTQEVNNNNDNKRPTVVSKNNNFLRTNSPAIGAVASSPSSFSTEISTPSAPMPTPSSSSPSPSQAPITSTVAKIRRKMISPVAKFASVSNLDNDISTKELFKHDPEMENAAIEWIEDLTKMKKSGTLHEWLKSGVVLCNLLNAIVPDTIKVINTSKISFKQRDNIAQYLKGCEEALGLKSTSLFQTVDLFEEKNMNSVITSIHVLGKAAAKFPGYRGPQIRQIVAKDNLLITSDTGLTDIVENSDPTEEELSLITWVNSHLSKRNIKINRLRSNLRNGVNLINLLEELSGLERLGVYERNPTNLWHCMQNAALILQFINQQTGEKVLGCTGPDITTGRLDPILNLIKLIRTKFDRDFVFKAQNLTEDSCRIKIFEELIETERTYIKLMSLLSEKILEPVKVAGEVPEEEQANIFSNMSEILEFNKGILSEFEKCYKDQSLSLPDVFNNRKQFIELYSKYVNNFDMASLMVKYNMKKYKSLKKLINKFESDQKEASGLDLASFLILPVQRLPRYVLLLKELQRYTPENHPEYKSLIDAIDHIARSLEIINESKREHEQSSHKILNIDKSMVYEMEDFEGIVHPKRKYLFEGVLKWDEQEEDYPYWFLFNDILVYCAQVSEEDGFLPGKQFRYVTLMPLRFIDNINDNPDIPTAFDMLMEDEVITLEAETVEKKDEWKNAVIAAKELKVDLDLVW